MVASTVMLYVFWTVKDLPDPGQAKILGGSVYVYDRNSQEFLLPYEAVRKADDPEATLLGFFQTTYEAAADLGRWDRAALEA